MATRRAWMELLGSETEPLFFSAKTRQGRDQLWKQLRLLIRSTDEASSASDNPAGSEQMPPD